MMITTYVELELLSVQMKKSASRIKEEGVVGATWCVREDFDLRE
jgi:hypothetical protein